MSARSELLEHALLSAWVVTSTSLLVHAYYEGAFEDYAWWVVPGSVPSQLRRGLEQRARTPQTQDALPRRRAADGRGRGRALA
jgi:hypothetical protein